MELKDTLHCSIYSLVQQTHAQSIKKAQNTMANVEPLHIRFSNYRDWYESTASVVNDNNLWYKFFIALTLYIQPSFDERRFAKLLLDGQET